MHKSTLASLDEVHNFLYVRSLRQRKLVLDQKALAAAMGEEQTRFHRLVQQLLKEDRIRQVGRGARGQKTVTVTDPALRTSNSQSSDAGSR